MKSPVFATLSLIACLAAPAAYPQSSPLAGAIPFDFHAGDTVLPAGKYTVTPNVSTGVAQIRCETCQGLKTILVMMQPVIAKSTPTNGKFVFRRYGDNYFLSQVWHPGSELGREI